MLIQKVKCRSLTVIFLSLFMIAGYAGETHSAEITVKQYGGGDYENIGAAITNAN